METHNTYIAHRHANMLQADTQHIEYMKHTNAGKQRAQIHDTMMSFVKAEELFIY